MPKLNRLYHLVRRPFVRLANLKQGKKDVIDFAFQRMGARSFADLGAVWSVAGGYSFYALRNYPIDSAFAVDFSFEGFDYRTAARFPQLKLLTGNFTSSEVADQIGRVDAVFLFDVLFHQVDPDWNEVLKLYADRTRCFLIHNPHYIDFKTTQRLIDLGEEEYFKCVPHRRFSQGTDYPLLFKNLDNQHPVYKRKYRDISSVWQWGITDHDLLQVMADLGFEPIYSKKLYRWKSIERPVEDHVFAFVRNAPQPGIGPALD